MIKASPLNPKSLMKNNSQVVKIPARLKIQCLRKSLEQKKDLYINLTQIRWSILKKENYQKQRILSRAIRMLSSGFYRRKRTSRESFLKNWE